MSGQQAPSSDFTTFLVPEDTRSCSPDTARYHCHHADIREVTAPRAALLTSVHLPMEITPQDEGTELISIVNKHILCILLVKSLHKIYL